MYTLYDVEVRGGFGGYAMCNPDANATYHCEQGSTRLVGLAQVETRYQEPEGPYNYDLWKFQASKLVRQPRPDSPYIPPCIPFATLRAWLRCIPWTGLDWKR